MSTTLADVLPLVIALVSVLITGALGYGSYRVSRAAAGLERERLHHEKTMIFWDKRVQVYSTVWAEVSEAYEEFLSWRAIADDAVEELRKWVVVKTVGEKRAADDPSMIEFDNAVKADPDGWLGWMLSERRVNIQELEASVRKEFFFLAPEHRELAMRIFTASANVRSSSSRAQFTQRFYEAAPEVEQAYSALNAEIDSTFYSSSSVHVV